LSDGALVVVQCSENEEKSFLSVSYCPCCLFGLRGYSETQEEWPIANCRLIVGISPSCIKEAKTGILMVWWKLKEPTIYECPF
jgi:hypothetical protein